MLNRREKLNKESVKRELTGHLSRVPGARLSSLTTDSGRATKGPGTALTAEITLHGRSLSLLIEVTAIGLPRAITEAIFNIRQRVATAPKKNVTLGVVVAPFIGATAAKLCEVAGIGYFDLSGNALLSSPGVFLERRVPENPFYVKREQRSLFSDKAARVVRTLLSHPGEEWRVASLADEARVSAGHVSQVRKLLLDRQWAEVSDEGLRLTHPEVLLDAWAAADDFSKRTEVQEFATLFAEPTEIARKLHAHFEIHTVEHAFTQWFAASLRRPHTTIPVVSVYVKEIPDVVAFCKDLLARPASPGGGKLRLIIPKDEGVLTPTQVVDGLPLVSDAQIYLDLLKAGLRGDEAAKELRAAPDFRGGAA